MLTFSTAVKGPLHYFQAYSDRLVPLLEAKDVQCAYCQVYYSIFVYVYWLEQRHLGLPHRNHSAPRFTSKKR